MSHQICYINKSNGSKALNIYFSFFLASPTPNVNCAFSVFFGCKQPFPTVWTKHFPHTNAPLFSERPPIFPPRRKGGQSEGCKKMKYYVHLYTINLAQQIHLFNNIFNILLGQKNKRIK